MRPRAGKAQDRTCLTCQDPVHWPALHFCSLPCVKEWIARAREQEPVLTAPKRKT